MTQEQADKLCAIVEKDALIQCLYCDDQDKTCALGGIALATGFPKNELKALRAKGITFTNRTQALVDHLERLGLSKSHADRIQVINDTFRELEKRRTLICDYIKSLI